MPNLAHIYFELSICSSCRLRILSRACPLPLQTKHSRSFSRSCRKKQEPANGDQVERQAPKGATGVLQFRHGKLVRANSRRLNLHEDRITLPIQALGEPAAIRVVRDKPQRPKEQAQLRSEPLEKESLEEFLKDATTKADILSDGEAVENIQQVHKAFLEKIGESEDPYLEECKALGHTLLNGFTANQLRAYVDSVGAVTAKEPYDLDALYKTPSYTRSRWFAGKSNFPDDAKRRLDPETGKQIDEGYSIMPRFQDADGLYYQKKKAALVEQVLRRCWSLRVREEKESPGCVDIRMDVNVLEVMLKQNNEIFTKISEAHGVKINVAPTLGFVRISGIFEVCRLALEAVIGYLSRVVVETMNLGSKVQVGGRRSQALWNQIEDLTRTRIVPRQKGNIDVFYLGPERTDLDDARRLVSQVREYVEQKPPDTQCFPQDVAPAFIPIDATSLGFIEQQDKWYRWRERDLTSKASGSLQQLTMPASQSRIINDLKKRFRSPWTTVESEHWDSRPKQTVSATFGSVSHAINKVHDLTRELSTLEGSRSQIKGHKADILKWVTQHRRAFVTNFPDVLMAMNDLVSGSPVMANSIRILMKPDSFPAPSLELAVNLDGGRKRTELDSVHLVYDAKVTDLLLPVHPVDVRFSSHTSFAAKRDNFDPAILAFLANSNLDVWGNERLVTPQKLQIMLPKRETGNAVQQPTHVQYSFSALSVCSDMGTLFEGFPLILSTIEAGKSGGRRDELKLQLQEYSERTSVNEERAETEGTLARWENQFLMWYGAVKSVVGRIPH